MTEEQFKKLMKQLCIMNENLQKISDGIESMKEDTDLLRQGLVDVPDDDDYIYSIPSMLEQIICDM